MTHLPDEILQQLADGALLDAERAQADAHLSQCPECQATVAEYREIFGGLEKLPAPPPPPRFTAAVMARIDVQQAALARQRRFALATLCGSALLALICFALAGGGAIANELTRLSIATVELGRFGHALANALAPVLAAWRIPLLASVAAVCIPTLLALHRTIVLRAEPAGA